MSDDDSVVVLFKGGRLPAWHDLAPETRDAYEQEHIDLMLPGDREHQVDVFLLIRVTGFGRQVVPGRQASALEQDDDRVVVAHATSRRTAASSTSMPMPGRDGIVTQPSTTGTGSV